MHAHKWKTRVDHDQLSGLSDNVLNYDNAGNGIKELPGAHETKGIAGKIPWGKVAVGVMASLRSFLRKRIFRRTNSFKKWTELDEWEDSEISNNDSRNQTDEDPEDRGHSYSIRYGVR
ncbi:hypothetical protein C922_04590 [Plasmodium inui San Antonio 1]|uniref:Uncharacterized protein n=1 Tax=Plasmodium inui San Antonio 1 TaxID=1237626 RepID=W7A0I6_9APIC|nr:hypothetical protein C922_04590 [Plasmodium inui San Antonio 1]EUD65075.1 hypothetical protein C922_04590 [Plasmodium inui San Antonio 1]